MKKLLLIIVLINLSSLVKAQTAYITNNNDNTVSVINVATNTVTATIPVGSAPVGVAVSPDGSKVYVSNNGDSTVSVINTATNNVLTTITVGYAPAGICVSPDGSKVYVANQVSKTISIINTVTNTVIVTITVGHYPFSMSASPDGSKIYYTNQYDNTVNVISTATNTVSNTISAGMWDMDLSPDGSKIYAVNGSYSNTVSVINSATYIVSNLITVGSGSWGISVSPNGSRAYVTNHSDNSVSVINTTTNSVIATIPVGTWPLGVSVSHDGGKVYVENYTANTISVINTTTNTVTATINVGSAPMTLGNFISPYNTYIQQPSIYTSGDVIICKGNDTIICAYGTGGTPPYQYLWSNNIISSCQTVSPIITTNYSVTITDANSSTATSALIVTVDTAAKPVITYSGSILFSTAGLIYQWCLNGNPISGATGQLYAPLSQGNYSVLVTYQNGCSAISDTFYVTGINELNNSFYISIYPNPATNYLSIETTQKFTIEILNMQGSTFFQKQLQQGKTDIDISRFSKGIYILKLSNDDKINMKKLIKE